MYTILKVGLILAVLVAPILAFYFTDVGSLIVVSAYGIYIGLYSFIQILCSWLNRRNIEKITREALPSDKFYNILVVGYREDPVLFKRCLESISLFTYNHNVNKILVIVDGDSQEDEYMVDIFNDVFLLDSTVEKTYEGYTNTTEKVICIPQEHGGKRSVLYTGLKLSCEQGVYGVICTDSDTVFDQDAVRNLQVVLEYEEDIGAVTGMVEIINRGSVIAYMSHLRYWFACNIERAYQSYNGCVLCVSGPLGVYKTEYLELFLEDWVNQTFLGTPCTYGDDRHLTNNILLLGKKVLYTHLAVCYTDTPESVVRFFTQQVRWCKSSYREVLWTVKCLGLHSSSMTVDLIYQTLYSLLVLGSLVYIVYFGTSTQLLIYIFTITFFNNMKGLYAVFLTNEMRYLLYSLYGFVYISIIVPARIYAGFTMKNVSWGTSSRLNLFDKLDAGIVVLGVWNMLLLAGVCWNIARDIEFLNTGYILFGGMGLYVFVNYIFLMYNVFIKT
jgi:hyaluronan synthase